MPQMAPLWWTTLFMTFVLTMSAVMYILYFLPNKKSGSMESNQYKISKSPILW
uniref:ATP synthase complex subunit 8 n=1 Tax=Carcinochelis bannaensis TaxID=2126074 RepID=A0A343W8P0_9HEMI|nr:ATP synthase F0 subunit 8 [Carcinochelis bannaensis]AVZ00730.1 ATP synthase F0 subunit 8 [Carcinochelis bannaensis]